MRWGEGEARARAGSGRGARNHRRERAQINPPSASRERREIIPRRPATPSSRTQTPRVALALLTLSSFRTDDRFQLIVHLPRGPRPDAPATRPIPRRELLPGGGRSDVAETPAAAAFSFTFAAASAASSSSAIAPSSRASCPRSRPDFLFSFLSRRRKAAVPVPSKPPTTTTRRGAFEKRRRRRRGFPRSNAALFCPRERERERERSAAEGSLPFSPSVPPSTFRSSLPTAPPRRARFPEDPPDSPHLKPQRAPPSPPPGGPSSPSSSSSSSSSSPTPSPRNLARTCTPRAPSPSRACGTARARPPAAAPSPKGSPRLSTRRRHA